MPDGLRHDFMKAPSESAAYVKKCGATACKYNLNGVCSAGFGIFLGINSISEEQMNTAAAE